MGAQTMGSQGGGVQEPRKSHSLTREGSLYSLTLNEVQNHLGNLGKPLSSMNLDELLKTVWMVEANQSSGVGTENSDSQQPIQLPPNPALPREGSLTLSRDLSNKTVNEVWRDIQLGNTMKNQEKLVQETQPALGEITLEDFLAKAGVVTESPPAKKNDGNVLQVNPQNDSPQAAHWMQYQLSAIQQPQPLHQQGNMVSAFLLNHPVRQPVPISVGSAMDSTYSEMQIAVAASPVRGTLSDTQTPGRKRVASGDVVEKSVERRQKRMIKNRESAARSRARKQAYTQELENKITRLEEEIERLKKEKEVEKAIPPPPEPKYQLRRTSSAPF